MATSTTVEEVDTAEIRQLAEDILKDEALAKQLSVTPAVARLLATRSGRDTAEKSQVPMPTVEQMRTYALQNIIPFVAFGFFDNAIMILSGDFIDSKLGIAFGVTTMCSMAIGNTVSGVTGIWLSGFIETVSGLLGLPVPESGLSIEQQKLLKMRILKNTSMVVGITVGCIIGMFPLIYPTEWRLWAARNVS